MRKYKQYIIFLSMLWLLIPFVLLTDLFPLFRFGMFAEPIRNTTSTEQWAVYYQNATLNYELLRSEDIGISEGHFTYLLRYYVYQRKLQQLFRQLHQIVSKQKKIISWEIRHIRQNKNFSRKDTFVIESWRIEK
jgi:hypothetical protein